MGAAPDLPRSCPAPARSRASDMQLHCFGGPCNEGHGVEDRIQPGVTPLGSQRWRCTYLTTGGTVGKLTARLPAKSADCPIFGFAVTLAYARPWRRARGLAMHRLAVRPPGFVGVIRAPGHQTYTQAMHGVTNRSVLPHIIWYMCYITATTYPQT